MSLKNLVKRLKKALPVILAGAPVLVDLIKQLKAALKSADDEEAPAAGETA